MWGARSANGPPGLTLVLVESWAAPETAIQHVVPASAVTCFDETAPASEHMALARDDTFAPAPVIQFGAPAPADTDTTPESMTEYVAPAPAVHYATPAPLVAFVTPSPVIEYNALAPSVTCFTPSPQSLLAYTMAAVTTGVTVDTARSVNSQSPITDVGASASQVAGSHPPVETMNVDSETFRREKWNLCRAAASMTEHFDLTADDSQDERLADGMRGCELACTCRTATPHRVMIGYTARRCLSVDGNVRREGHHSRAQGEQDSNQKRAANHGRQADSIETEGDTLEEHRLEYRELLGEMAIYEEDLHGAELKYYNDLATIPWWEHDETEDAERELRILRDGARRLILHLLHMQNTAPPKRGRRIKRQEEAKMSGCVSPPTHPAPSPIPLGALSGWGGEVGGETGGPPPHRVDGAFVEASISGRKDCRWTEHAHVGANSGPIVSFRVVSLCSLTLERKFEVIVSPVRAYVSAFANQTQTSAVHCTLNTERILDPTVAPVRFV